MLETKPRRQRSTTPRISRWMQWWRAWRVFRLLMWTIWIIYRERRRVLRARERGNYDVHPNIDVLIKVLVAFRATSIKLGVLMIKLGQFLSSRADILPQQALDILAALQDEVPPAPFSHVVSVIETELGKPVEQIYSVLERKCTAAASFGQVHKGVLAATGEAVAVKVQRPNIDRLVRSDLSTLKFVIWVINRFVDTSEFIDLMGFYREFRRTVYEEIDYVTEAANAKRFKEMFKDDPTIYIPDVYTDYTSRRVLTLEWIDGFKINDYEALEAAGVNRLEIAERTVKAYFYQFFATGFFHADPHPGNIFVLTQDKLASQVKAKKEHHPDAPVKSYQTPVVAFVDFGMVGTLSKNLKKAMKDIFLGFVAKDSHSLVGAMANMGFIGQDANIAAIERGMALMMEQYFGMTLGQVREIDIPDVSHEIEDLLYGQPFYIPAQFAFTGKAVGTLVGVATGLAPEFNFIDVATPYAREFLGLDSGAGIAGQTIQELLNQLLETGRTLLTLPRSLERVITKLETGQIEVRLATAPRNGHGRRRGRGRRDNNGNGNGYENGSSPALSGLTWALLFLVEVAAGVTLTVMHQSIPGWFCLGLAGVTALGLLIKR